MEELTYRKWFEKRLPPDVAEKAIRSAEVQNPMSILDTTWKRGRYLRSASECH